ncbi:MAG: hypothetical protein Q9M34_01915 [Sulfurimonas sp.]|nr:hypothetical protein [Sulfurimonas sp.]
MFGNLLKKNRTKDEDIDASLQELILKIDKMNLTQMRSLVKDKTKESELSTEGLNAVLQKLITVTDTSKKQYINSDDMDSKKKKAFDLVLAIMANKKINIQTIELVQKFIDTYEEIINRYDKEYKDIYLSRFKDSITNAVVMLGIVSDMENKLNVLSE